jgi:DinB superfamily
MSPGSGRPMDAGELFLVQHASLHAAGAGSEPSYFDRALAGLTEAEMRLRPLPGVNSIVWLLWHMARTEDVSTNLVVADGRQVLDDAWLRRLGVPWRHIGTGMTDGEVSELSRTADVAAVRAYRDAVARRTREVVGTLPPSAWAEPVGIADTTRAAAAGAFGPRAAWTEGAGFRPWQDQSRAARLAGAALRHNALHLGEIVTVRGLAGRGLGT